MITSSATASAYSISADGLNFIAEHEGVRGQAQVDGIGLFSGTRQLFGQQLRGIGHEFGAAPLGVRLGPAVGACHHERIAGIPAPVGAALDMVQTVESNAALVQSISFLVQYVTITVFFGGVVK